MTSPPSAQPSPTDPAARAAVALARRDGRPMRDLRQILVRRASGVVVLLALSMLRLLTSLGFSSAVATELYLLAVTGVVLFWCFQVLAGLPRSDPFWSRAARRSNLRDRPERLVVLEEMYAFWVRTGYTVQRRLRPAVRLLVAGRLSREGIDLDRDPRAPTILGPTTWDLVRADAEQPTDDRAGGLTPRQADEITRTLTALGRVDVTRAGQTGEQH